MKPEDVLVIDDGVTEGCPDAGAGVLLVEGIEAAAPPALLEEVRLQAESSLRARYAGQDRAALAALPPFPSYIAFYKRFKKTYHVLLQLESVALKQRSIASPGGLVTAMFMAELESGLLSAGHDPRALTLPLRLLTAAGGEDFETMSGEVKQLKAGDLHMADRDGTVSSVIYGPDRRTQLQPDTASVLYTTYAVPGVTDAELARHLDILESYVQRLHPEAVTALKGTFRAPPPR